MTLETNTMPLAEAQPHMNGVNQGGAGPATSDAPRISPRDARQARMAHSFSNVLAVLMRDPSYRNVRLADLEWLVLPPVMAGQFKLGQAPADPAPANPAAGGLLVPVAVALWARVSDAVDQVLTESTDNRLWLRPNEWASGSHIWLMTVAGDPRAVPTFLRELAATEFSGQVVKMRTHETDGKVVIKTLDSPG